MLWLAKYNLNIFMYIYILEKIRRQSLIVFQKFKLVSNVQSLIGQVFLDLKTKPN